MVVESGDGARGALCGVDTQIRAGESRRPSVGCGFLEVSRLSFHNVLVSCRREENTPLASFMSSYNHPLSLPPRVFEI